MAFLKTLFWVIVAVIVTLLWLNSPRVDLPIGTEETGGLAINSRLGTWIILSFLIGFLPPFLYHKTVKWRMGRRIRTLEDQVARANTPAPAKIEPKAESGESKADTSDAAPAPAVPHEAGPSPAELAAERRAETAPSGDGPEASEASEGYTVDPEENDDKGKNA